MKHRGKIIGGVSFMILAIIGCIIHSIENEPSLMNYYYNILGAGFIGAYLGLGFDLMY